MAHYAFLDKNNIVTEVIVGIDETETIEGLDTEIWYGTYRGQLCKRTSYNGNIRFNYAGIGYTYDEGKDAFIAPQTNCHAQEVLDEATCRWTCTNGEHLTEIPPKAALSTPIVSSDADQEAPHGN